jgi:acyl-CoA thioesterase-1
MRLARALAVAYCSSMRVRELAGIAALLGTPVIALGYAITKTLKLPDNTPARFRRVGSKTVVACLGASMIQGRLSFDLVAALQARLGSEYQLVNAGVNGDLAWNARMRLDHVIACDPDYVIVLVGSNDVMATQSSADERRYRRLKKLPERPTLSWYKQNLRALVAGLQRHTRAEIAICSLPPLGERLDAPINQHLAAYNAVIRQTANDQEVAYLSVHETLATALGKMGRLHPKPFDGSRWTMAWAAIQRYVLGRSWDDIARRQGYALLTDGVHLSERAGALVVERLLPFLSAPEPQPGDTMTNGHAS